MRVLITGATGLIGGRLFRALRADGHDVRGASRRRPIDTGQVYVEGLGPATSWTTALEDVEAVIHAAAHVHKDENAGSNPDADYHLINTEGTLNLARQAAEIGIRRFIFLSSIKVNGEQTPPGRPFRAEDAPRPEGPYAISKWRAEQGLQDMMRATRMEIVILRPPLVYGPGVRANFNLLMAAIARGIPLPLASVRNLRSLLALDNLVDLITRCLMHPAAVNQTFLASDGLDLSTPDLVRRLAGAMNRPARLVPISPNFLFSMAALLGKRHVIQRLCGSLQVDIDKTRLMLGWEPPLSVDSGLAAVARWYTDKH